MQSPDEEPGFARPETAGYMGWQGKGGTACRWHPELKIGFAYASTYLPIANYDFKENLQKAVVECVKRLENQNS